MGYGVRIDQDVCISSGKCVADAPETFAFDDEELAEVRADAAELADARLIAIARNCPSGAIQLLDGDQPVAVD